MLLSRLVIIITDEEVVNGGVVVRNVQYVTFRFDFLFSKPGLQADV